MDGFHFQRYLARTSLDDMAQGRNFGDSDGLEKYLLMALPRSCARNHRTNPRCSEGCISLAGTGLDINLLGWANPYQHAPSVHAARSNSDLSQYHSLIHPSPNAIIISPRDTAASQ